ncbi:MAG: preprotein translocase subunit SecE [Anaerolineae bacterium]
MSAENTTDTKSSRRRRRTAEVEEQVKNQVAAEVEDDIEDDEDAEDADESSGKGITAKKGRPTPGRRNRVEEEEEGNAVTRTVGGLRGYFEDTAEELRKVTWPTREEVRRLTLVVLAVTIAASLVLGAISLLFTELIRAGIAQPIILVAVFVVAVAVVLGFLYYNSRSSSSY